MTEAAKYVAELEAIDQQARALMLGPLEALRALPDPPPPAAPVLHGADLANIDLDHVVTTPIRDKGMKLTNCVVDARVYSSAWDLQLTDVLLTGGVPATVQRPMAEFGPGVMLEGVTAKPRIESVYWGDVRFTGTCYTRGVWVTRTVDGVGVVTAAGQSTNQTHVDLRADDLAWYAWDPKHKGDGTHNDPMQLHGYIDGLTLIRPVFGGGEKGTACIMANVPSVYDLTVVQGEFSGARSGVNFGPTTKGERVAIVDGLFDCPVDVYATDALAGAVRLDGSVRVDGQPATITRSG